MNQELMTLDFWQDTVIYEGKIFPIGTLACDALNVPADTLARMNEQCEKINENGTSEIVRLADWDTMKTNRFANKAIAYLLNCENEKLPKETIVAFEL